MYMQQSCRLHCGLLYLLQCVLRHVYPSVHAHRLTLQLFNKLQHNGLELIKSVDHYLDCYPVNTQWVRLLLGMPSKPLWNPYTHDLSRIW